MHRYLVGFVGRTLGSLLAVLGAAAGLFAGMLTIQTLGLTGIPATLTWLTAVCLGMILAALLLTMLVDGDGDA